MSYSVRSPRKDGIIHVVFRTNEELSPELAMEYLNAQQELVGEQSVPVGVEIVRIPWPDRGVRALFLSAMPQHEVPCGGRDPRAQPGCRRVW